MGRLTKTLILRLPRKRQMYKVTRPKCVERRYLAVSSWRTDAGSDSVFFYHAAVAFCHFVKIAAVGLVVVGVNRERKAAVKV